ncbi:MAG: PilZ domain-containing protein, partial [Pseudomonadota bacterium]
MFSHLQLREIESDDSREGARYLSKGHGRFTGDTAQPVACDIINISYSGAAVKCYGALKIGEKYKIEVLGLGAFPCRVVRSFDADSFGIRFDISLEGKLRLRKRLDEMFQQAHSEATNPTTVPTKFVTPVSPTTTQCFKRVMLAPDVGDAIDFA